MVQESKTQNIGAAQLIAQYDFNEEENLTDEFQSILKINSPKILKSIFQFKHIPEATETVDYKIYGSIKYAIDLEDADPERDDGWVNLLSTGTYDHNTQKSIDNNSREFDTISNSWKWIIVMAKVSTGTGRLSVWHYGRV